MSEDPAPYGEFNKPLDKQPKKRLPKIPMEISPLEKDVIMAIAAKAKELRQATGLSYENFAIKAGINRISYFRFEKSSSTGDNYTVALLAKVILALKQTPKEFFKDIK